MIAFIWSCVCDITWLYLYGTVFTTSRDCIYMI